MNFDIETDAASEQEQQQYEQAFDMAMEALHSDGTGDVIAKTVLSAQDMAEGVAEAVFMLVRRLESQLGGLEDAVKIEVAQDLTEEILDLLIEGGHITEGEANEEFIERVIALLYKRYLQDQDERGELHMDGIREDVAAAQKMGGVNAMSTPEAERRGLLSRGS